MMTKTITFATSNKGKAITLERALKVFHLHDWSVDVRSMDLLELQSSSLEEISLHKARQAFAAVKKPVIVMDGGFYINQLNGFPGPFARYMFDQMGVENIARMVSTFDDHSCYFKNVVTYIESEDDYQQFHDSTADIYTLTDKIWPTDHPEQWSAMWRILVPSGLGYAQPLASMNDAELQTYAEKRAQYDKGDSVLNKFAKYLSETAIREKAHA
jgi:non-canonical purine NTP pyrophosphatase (RdgB/HAM1 family)